MREENSAEQPGGLPPSPLVGKSLFYASPTVPNPPELQEQERAQPTSPTPPENPEWNKLLGEYYSDLSEVIEKSVATAMTLLEVALRVKRDAEALFAKAHARQPELETEVDRLRAQRTALEQEMNALLGARQRLHREVEEILADTFERIRGLSYPEAPGRGRTESGTGSPS